MPDAHDPQAEHAAQRQDEDSGGDGISVTAPALDGGTGPGFRESGDKNGAGTRGSLCLGSLSRCSRPLSTRIARTAITARGGRLPIIGSKNGGICGINRAVVVVIGVVTIGDSVAVGVCIGVDRGWRWRRTGNGWIERGAVDGIWDSVVVIVRGPNQRRSASSMCALLLENVAHVARGRSRDTPY